MEGNYRKTDATLERASSNRIGTVELRDGHLTFMWPDFGFK